jgi:hypothetical protein
MVSDDLVDLSGDEPGDIPLACSLTATELNLRGEENASLFAHAQGKEELPDGYRFTFPAEGDGARDLLQFVLAERACCPFFTFELIFPSPHQTIYLTVRGREGVKEIVRASVASTVTPRAGAKAEADPAV